MMAEDTPVILAEDVTVVVIRDEALLVVLVTVLWASVGVMTEDTTAEDTVLLLAEDLVLLVAVTVTELEDALFTAVGGCPPCGVIFK